MPPQEEGELVQGNGPRVAAWGWFVRTRTHDPDTTSLSTVAPVAVSLACDARHAGGALSWRPACVRWVVAKGRISLFKGGTGLFTRDNQPKPVQPRRTHTPTRSSARAPQGEAELAFSLHRAHPPIRSTTSNGERVRQRSQA